MGCANVQALKPTEYSPVQESQFTPFVIETYGIIHLERNNHYIPAPAVVIKPTIKPRIIIIRPLVVHIPSTAAKAYAYHLIGAVQYGCLDNIFTRESHWNPLDLNKNSGAYGIPQAVPGSKMASAGADWRTNPITQVKWGIHYINSRYGSPCRAWAFWQVHHWY